MNCQDADLVVIFGNVKSAGSRLTIDICECDHIPYLLNPDAQELHDHAEMLKAEVINIAGNRASVDEGIQERVRKVVREAFSDE
jgi:hypothetical protein